MKKSIALLLALIMMLSMAACSSDQGGSQTASEDSGAAAETQTASTDPALTDPFGKYAEPVTIHLVGGVDPNQKFPEGQSKEKNDYLDFIKEEFNIDVVYDWVTASTQYADKLNLAIGSGDELPDVMMVNATQYRALLKYGYLQDITTAFDNTASDMLKSFVSSGGEALDKLITVDGKMMAVPAPELTSSSVDSLWIRQDWLDELGLPVPKTVEEVLSTAKAFVENDMAGDGTTIGILGPANTGDVSGIGGNWYGFNPIFAAFDSFPKYWQKNEAGEIYYGSTTQETKKALEFMAKMYAEGAIDPEMFVRSNSSEPMLAGKAGMMFGPWWVGYPAQDSITQLKIDWQAYAVPLNGEGKYVDAMSAPATNFVVVNKNCENPEAAMKIINLLLRDEQKWIASGLKEQLNPSEAYPLFQVFDNANEIEYSYDALKKLLAGEIAIDDIDYSTHKLLKNDMEVIQILKKEPLDDFGVNNWDLENEMAGANMGRLVSVMIGGRALVEGGYEPLYSEFYGQTETMATKWANLEKLEKETFAKIILGQAPLDSFDEFVTRWNAEGGAEIITEITEAVK